jgi:sugar lactone lactonase YvrE
VVGTTSIFVYNGADGELLREIKADRDIFTFGDITAAADGTLYVVGGGETVLQMDANGKTLMTIPDAISTITERPESLAKIAVDGEGNIYLLGGTGNSAVFTYNSKGKYINKFGSDGDEQGQFRAPYSIAVDGQGRIYVSDIKGIQVFDADGRYVDKIDPEGVVFGMVFDDDNKLYVTSNVSKVFKFAIEK